MSARLVLPQRAFVDTAAYFALSATRERVHDDAVAISERLRHERWALYTTNFVLAETHALFLNRVNRRVALQTLERIEASATHITRVSPADERRAREILRQYDDKDFTLTDATSFAVMDRLGIRHAFTFDGNFAQYGKVILTPTN